MNPTPPPSLSLSPTPSRPSPPLRRLLGALGAAAALAACTTTPKQPGNAVYDFGAPVVAAAPAAAPLPALVVAAVGGPPALDNERMVYRLNYADPLQARTYAMSRWGSSPLEMLTQRFKSRLSQAGVKVLSPEDAALGIPLLRIEVDDFSHVFDSPGASHGQVVLRASLFDGHRLLDQRTFSRKSAATSADAGGGARALAASADAVAGEMLAWLAAAPKK
ncbi:ABC-type transport auxiliary lipoprotein family protein [Massilia glaciei]|uniref:ABC-type transport auxiliary lipoprotein family protein n=1 Tax=Massilia glaciei TaxID=1524097 RepID=UPI001E2E946B|nr:ABC-type transport auxiliary lipoprotein family protein [Massilia glaciei]